MRIRTLVWLIFVAIASAPLSGRVMYVAVGDSITEGTGDETNRGGYPPRLQARLQAQGVDAVIDNRGVGGETTVGALLRFHTILANGGDVLLIMEGTNDITRHISPETILFNLEELARRGEAQGFEIVHSTMIPRIPSARVDPNNRTNELVGAMIINMAIAKERPFADPYREFIRLPLPFENYYWKEVTDPVGHPNAAGYDVLAESFLLPASSPCFLGAGISAAFDLSSAGGQAPVAVQFTDLSPAEVVSWAWDFQDDGIVDSQDQHPVFSYTEEGTYSVRLRISNGQCTATRLMTDAVTILPGTAVPGELTASSASASAIDLTWIDNAVDETYYVLEARKGTEDFSVLEFLPADTTSHQVTGLDERSYCAFRVQSGNLEGTSDYSNEAAATTLGVPAACSFSDEELCLANGRIVAKVEWRDHDDGRGTGHASQLSGDSGVFWFFDEANLELVVKALDGTGINGYFWTFFGSLTEVEFVLVLMDTETGLTRAYVNLEGEYGSVGDTESFPGTPPAMPQALAAEIEPLDSCTADPGILCLQDGRFELSVQWEDFEGSTGTGIAIPGTSDTGFFWFFNEENIELAIKVLDGRSINDHFWVFFGALSNVEYTVTVVDTATGNEKIYFNPSGAFASFGDTEAFPADPD